MESLKKVLFCHWWKRCPWLMGCINAACGSLPTASLACELDFCASVSLPLKISLSAQLLWLSAVTPGQPAWIWDLQEIIYSHLCYCAISQPAKQGDPAVKASCWKPPLMPPDSCDIDSFSGSHATGLGWASISSFLPVFSSSALEIPTQFPSPPARAPRASMHPSALGDPFHPALLSACPTLPVHRRLQTHGCLLCTCVCVCGGLIHPSEGSVGGLDWPGTSVTWISSNMESLDLVFLSTSKCFVHWMVFWAVRRSEALS